MEVNEGGGLVVAGGGETEVNAECGLGNDVGGKLQGDVGEGDVFVEIGL